MSAEMNPATLRAIEHALLVILEEISERCYAAAHMMDLERDVWRRLGVYREEGGSEVPGWGMCAGRELVEKMPVIDALASLIKWDGRDLREFDEPDPDAAS